MVYFCPGYDSIHSGTAGGLKSMTHPIPQLFIAGYQYLSALQSRDQPVNTLVVSGWFRVRAFSSP